MKVKTQNLNSYTSRFVSDLAFLFNRLGWETLATEDKNLIVEIPEKDKRIWDMLEELDAI